MPAESRLQLTLVAWLETRPPALEVLLQDLRRRLGDALGAGFEPYAPGQIHATLVGLERAPGTRRDNANLSSFEGRSVPMDLEGFVGDVAHSDAFPLSVRFGGFGPDERPFTSRCRTPWERGFSIQGDKAVLIGWPVGDASHPWPTAVDALRRRADRFGIRHTYHRAMGDFDNDLYLRLGRVRESDSGMLRRLENELREQLAGTSVTVPLTVDDLRIAAYRDPTLAPATTRGYRLTELTGPGRIAGLLD